MKDYRISEEVVDEIFEDIKDFEDYLTERIEDLYEVKGGIQARHAYIFYRKMLWDIRNKISENLIIQANDKDTSKNSD